MQPKTNTDPMDEAYKLLDGEPAQDAVSQAAKGNVPLSDNEYRMKNAQPDPLCTDINDAYAMLFSALSVIMGKKA